MHTRPTRAVSVLVVLLFAAFGITLATASAASAHTPAANLTCTSWSFGATGYSANEDNTYSYSVDGATPVTGHFRTSFGTFRGTFPTGSGNHTLVGYVYQNNDPKASYSHTYNLSTKDCETITTVPVPGAPTPTAPTCTTNGELIVPPSTDSVTWTSTPSGTGPGMYTLTATATAHHVFSDGKTTETYTVTVLPKLTGEQCAPPQIVTPQSPAVVQSACTGPGTHSTPTVTPAATEHVTYTVSADLSTVTATADAGWTLAPAEGWVLGEGSTTATFAVVLSNPGDCLVTAVPAHLTKTSPTCFQRNVTAQIPDTTGVNYVAAGKVLNGTEITVRPGDKPVTITTVAQTGYTLSSAPAPFLVADNLDTGKCDVQDTRGVATTVPSSPTVLPLTPVSNVSSLPNTGSGNVGLLASSGIALLVLGGLAMVGFRKSGRFGVDSKHHSA